MITDIMTGEWEPRDFIVSIFPFFFFFSICSGSVELNESKNISVDYEKASSLSSDEGMQSAQTAAHGQYMIATKKVPQNSPTKFKGTNTLLVQPLIHLGQSLPNLNLNSTHISNNTLLVPGSGTVTTHSNLLSPSHRGISYPPPSPTRYILPINLH